MTLRRWRRDHEGSIQVFEAVIVAVMILTAVLFFTSLQRPTRSSDAGGIDLGVLASDVLVVLHERNFTDPADSEAPALELIDWVERAASGDQAVAQAVDTFMRGVLGGGMRYEIRLDNGIEPLRLLPYGAEPLPLAARASSTFVFPEWTANQTGFSGAVTWPGAALDCTGWTAVFAPTGVNPQGDIHGPDLEPGAAAYAWVGHWQAACGSSVASGERHVPMDIPFGVWGYEAPGCDDCFVWVGLPDGTQAAHVPYGLQLLLWQGA